MTMQFNLGMTGILGAILFSLLWILHVPAPHFAAPSITPLLIACGLVLPFAMRWCAIKAEEFLRMRFTQIR